jgi:hypothetical protein
MSDWYCFKDKVKMLEENVPLRYLQLERHVPGLKCPVCGVLYLTEYVVRTVVRTAEEYIELK